MGNYHSTAAARTHIKRARCGAAIGRGAVVRDLWVLVLCLCAAPHVVAFNYTV